MPRVKRGTTSLKKRHNILKKTKGYIFGRSTKERAARQAIAKAGQNAFKHRKTKKRDFRALWNNRISAAVKPLGLSYSKFINALKVKNIALDRKVLAELAKDHPEVFTQVVEAVK